MSSLEKEELELISKREFEILPLFFSLENEETFFSYTSSFEALFKKILAQEIPKETQDLNKDFYTLQNKLPIIQVSQLKQFPGTLSFSFLTSGKYSYGIGRYSADMISRWLIPGRSLPILGDRSLMFHLKGFEGYHFFLCEYFLNITEEKDFFFIQKNLPSFIEEMKLNISAVNHIRHITSLNKLSREEESAIIQENLSSLMERYSHGFPHSTFNQVHDFLSKISTEKKLSEIKENISSLMQKRPQEFDRDIFDSIHDVIMLFRGKFASLRNPRHVSRIISYQYLFKRLIKENMAKSPKERHVLIKFLKSHENDGKNPAIGILITFNFLEDTERFEKIHIQQAVQTILPNATYIKESYIADKRDDKVHSYYMEIKNAQNTNFSLIELKKLRAELPNEIKERVENFIHPIFMPRNDEEILRNIIMLSKQLKYVRDIPQVIISYDKQSTGELSFLVILLRILRPESIPLKELFLYSQTFLKFSNDEVKIIGHLKKKYIKEAVIFKLSLPKAPYFRKDFTLDLQKARQELVKELTHVIGEFRDFNGGMILKQNETLGQLKKSFSQKTDEFLLENFFYSLYPSTMSSLLPIHILKKLFIMVQKILRKKQSGIASFEQIDKYFLAAFKNSSSETKEKIRREIAKLEIPSHDIANAYIEIGEEYAVGYIYRFQNEETKNAFEKIFKKQGD